MGWYNIGLSWGLRGWMISVGGWRVVVGGSICLYELLGLRLLVSGLSTSGF